MSNLFGSLRKLVSLVFSEDGQVVSVEPNNAVAYTGTTIYELPPKASGTEILVGTTASQSLSNKALVVPTFTGGAIDIPAGSTIGGSAIGGGGGVNLAANYAWTGTHTFDSTQPNQFRGNAASLVDVANVQAGQINSLGASIGTLIVGSINANTGISVGADAVLTTMTGATLNNNNTFNGTSTFISSASFSAGQPNQYLGDSSSVCNVGGMNTNNIAVGVGGAIISGNLMVTGNTNFTNIPTVGGSGNVLTATTGAQLSGVNTFTSANNFSAGVSNQYLGDSSSICSVNSGVFEGGLKVPLSTASNPIGPTAGQIQYNTTTNKLQVFNGTTWETITSL